MEKHEDGETRIKTEGEEGKQNDSRGGGSGNRITKRLRREGGREAEK